MAFVGDGINDAPAHSQADLGLAVAGHGGAAIAADDVMLVQAGPARAVIALARRTYSTIRQNLVWAFAYNVAALPLAAFGVLDPMIAAGAMAASSFSVVANSLRLKRFKGEPTA